ncbi:hypothetical protein KR032_010593 [Drosophila birchii]|nr:hypothetical protein KR032_010593 [Drosophila birchii]
MACYCWWLRRLVNNCCCCYTLRLGVLLFGSIFLVWFSYLTVGTAFMMESIFPDEYQKKSPQPAALKTTMVFSFFGIITSAMMCLGVHNNNEMLFLPFLGFAPIWILVHILVMFAYSFKVAIIFLMLLTIGLLIYAWIVVWSYYVELLFAYESELENGFA